MPDRLGELLHHMAAGETSHLVGQLTVLPQPCHRDAAVIALTGHSVVVADLDPRRSGSAWPRSRQGAGHGGTPPSPTL